jgi:putative transposase
MAESFREDLQRELRVMHELKDAVAVMEQMPSWFEDYNEFTPKGLKMRSPREYRRSLTKIEGCPV